MSAYRSPITKVTCQNHALPTTIWLVPQNGGRPTNLRNRGEMARRPLIRIALVERDPLRVVGFRALFDSASGFELVSASLPDIVGLQNIDLVLLSNCSAQTLLDLMASL